MKADIEGTGVNLGPVSPKILTPPKNNSPVIMN